MGRKVLIRSLHNNFVCSASDSQADKIVAPNRKKYEDDMEAVMNEIKEKDALLVSFLHPVSLRQLLFLLTVG